VVLRARLRGTRPAYDSAYDPPIDRAYAAALLDVEELERERAEASGRVPQLLASANPLDELLAGSEAEPVTWGLCEALLETSAAWRGEDPRESVRAVELAALAVERLDSSRHGRENLADFRARVWAELGNAYRTSDALAAAEHAMRRALELRRLGTGDPLLLARIAELFASLRIAQRCFGEALRMLDIAYSLYMAQGDSRSAGRAAVKEGIAAGHSGDAEEAAAILAGALPLLDRRRDGRLAFTALHNLLWFQVESGAFREARLLLFDVQSLYLRYAAPIDRIKLRWLEGRIAAGLGDLDRAERAFVHARQGLAEAGLAFHAAIAALDLGEIWLRQGRTAEVRGLVEELVAAFRAVGVEREALAALLMLRDALRRDAADLESLRFVASCLKRLDRDPGREAGLSGASTET
jgi:tetratricopeptide (TPR) repeat protein